MWNTPLKSTFYDRDVVQVARDLLGKLLVRRTAEGSSVGRIVEVEAYLAKNDTACHAHRGRTRKNATMFGPPGRAYVYPIHSRHCMNVVTEAQGTASAVLIRALEPVDGVSLMQRRRGTTKLLDTARGPGRLCEALAIDRALDGWDLACGRRLWIAAADDACSEPYHIGISPRIGVTSAQDAPLRFFVDGSPFVSGPRKWHSDFTP
jgi:DNA-3-methyladenine glycosylase